MKFSKVYILERTLFFEKIGLQCILGVLCLVLFLLVGMLFSNISIWEFICNKWEGRQGENIWQNMAYFIFICIKVYYWRLSSKKGIYLQFHIMDITIRGQTFGNKTFSYILCIKCPYHQNFYFLIQFYISPNELLRIKNLICIKYNLCQKCKKRSNLPPFWSTICTSLPLVWIELWRRLRNTWLQAWLILLVLPL